MNAVTTEHQTDPEGGGRLDRLDAAGEGATPGGAREPETPRPSPSPGPPPAGARRPWDMPNYDPFYASRRRSPALAGILSGILPGVGQVYLGYYARGFFNAVVFAGTITILSTGPGRATPLLAIFLSFFWVYNIVDAARLASLYNQVLLGIAQGDPIRPQTLPSPGGMIPAGILLTGLGLLLFLNTAMGMSLDWLEEVWPLGPLGFGAWLLIRGLQDRRRSRGE